MIRTSSSRKECAASKRYTKANNHQIDGPSKPNNHILYVDTINLPGLVISRALLTGYEFDWIKDCKAGSFGQRLHQ